jgi:capsular polysaccharide biosynthesis protein
VLYAPYMILALTIFFFFATTSIFSFFILFESENKNTKINIDRRRKKALIFQHTKACNTIESENGKMNESF